MRYSDHVSWQRDLLGDPEAPTELAKRQLAYWRDRLAGLPEEIDLPTDRMRPAVATGRDLSYGLPSPPGFARGSLSSPGKTRRALMVLQAAVAVLLSRLGAGADIPLGTAVAGRPDESLDELVGYLVNVVVLRTDLSGEPTFRELLRRVRRRIWHAYTHQDLPFEWLVKELNPPRPGTGTHCFRPQWNSIWTTQGTDNHSPG